METDFLRMCVAHTFVSQKMGLTLGFKLFLSHAFDKITRTFVIDKKKKKSKCLISHFTELKWLHLKFLKIKFIKHPQMVSSWSKLVIIWSSLGLTTKPSWSSSSQLTCSTNICFLDIQAEIHV